MRLIRTLIVCISLVAHLVGSVAYSAPRFIEICTVHGVKSVPSDDNAEPCEICLAICDLVAAGTTSPAQHKLQAAVMPQPPAKRIAASSLAPRTNNRDPPRFV